MDSGNFEDDERCDRFTILKKLSAKLSENSWLIPSASQESSYKEALSHVACICSNNTDIPPQGTVLSCRLKDCSRDKSRKHCLKEVLALLQSMQRKRLYDPPGDDEVQHYMLLERSIRSLIIFFDAQILQPASPNFAKLGCFTFFPALGEMQRLVELNWHFADLSAFVSEMDIRNGSSIKPWMSIKHNEEMESVFYGNKEKSNMFYKHRFSLALLDLRSTEFLFSSPSAEEMRCYVQVANAFPENHGQPFINKEKTNIYSSQLDYLLRERIHREASDIRRHFRQIVMAIFEKLSISEHLESLGKKLAYRPFSLGRSLFETFADFGKKMSEKYKGSDQDLPSYIAHVDRCLFLSSYMSWLILSYDDSAFLNMMVDLFFIPSLRERVGWIALHAVTLLKRGSVVNRSLFQSQPGLQKVNRKVPREVLHESKRKCKCSSPDEGKSDNVKTLEDILEIVRVIGDADMKQLDEEEKQIMIKIWQNVASPVHFFFLAMAYEQRRFLMEHDVSPSACMRGVRPKKKRNSLTTNTFGNFLYKLRYDMRFLTIVLDSYKDGLLERLQKLQQMQIMVPM